MSPTPEELELGEKAYKQVRFYENVTVKDIRQTPWLFAIYAGLIALGFILLIPHKNPKDLLFLLFIPVFFTARIWQIQVAKVHYATHKMLLHLLEEKYGDVLPWVVEEKQLARARELEAEIARERQASHA